MLLKRFSAENLPVSSRHPGLLQPVTEAFQCLAAGRTFLLS